MEQLNMLIGTEEALAGANESGHYITLNQDTGDMDLYLDDQKIVGINKDRLEGKQDKFGEVIKDEYGNTLKLDQYLNKIESNEKNGLTLQGSALALDSKTGSIYCNNNILTQVAEPTSDYDAATKGYVDKEVKKIGVNITVDQTYKAKSENAQSGIAVAEAVMYKAELETITLEEPPIIEQCIIFPGNSGYDYESGLYCYTYDTEEDGISYSVFVDEKNGNQFYFKFTNKPIELTLGNLVFILFRQPGSPDPIIDDFTIFKDVSDKQDKFADVAEDENQRIVEFKYNSGVIKNSLGGLNFEGKVLNLDPENKSIYVNNSKIESLASPEQEDDAATKGYVDNSLTYKADISWTSDIVEFVGGDDDVITGGIWKLRGTITRAEEDNVYTIPIQSLDERIQATIVIKSESIEFERNGDSQRLVKLIFSDRLVKGEFFEFGFSLNLSNMQTRLSFGEGFDIKSDGRITADVTLDYIKNILGPNLTTYITAGGTIEEYIAEQLGTDN